MPKDKEQRIFLVDATSLGGRITGMERYTYNVVKQLVVLSSEYRFRVVTLLRKGAYDVFFESDYHSFERVYSPFSSIIMTEQVFIPMTVVSVNPFACFFPAFSPSPLLRMLKKKTGKHIRTVHDAVMWRKKETLSLKTKLYYLPIETFWMKTKGYDVIHTVSEYSKKELEKVFPFLEGRIVNSGNGIRREQFSQTPSQKEVDAVKEKYGLPDRYLLFVGTLEPRKNLLFLLDVMVTLAKIGNDMSLVIAGRFGWGTGEFLDRVRVLRLESRIVLIGAVPDSELPILYHAAAILVFPSFYEGFGLPVVEAMAAGLPVIASNTSSIPEAGGSAAMLLSPADREGWANAIVKVLGDRNLARNMVEKGKEHIWQFTWENVARKILETAS